MELTWIHREATDSDGDKYQMHYLVHEATQQCMATITAPRFGNLLWVSDLRIAGNDRSWMTLDAAMGYCESCAEMENTLVTQELEGRHTQPSVEGRVRSDAGQPIG